MFKDFHRRLQRDIKKIVDARVLAAEARLNGEIKVRVKWIFLTKIDDCIGNSCIILFAQAILSKTSQPLTDHCFISNNYINIHFTI